MISTFQEVLVGVGLSASVAAIPLAICLDRRRAGLRPASQVLNSYYRRARWKFWERYSRVRLGVRYALGRLTKDEAVDMRVECYHISGDYPLSYLSVSSVLDEFHDRYKPSPTLEALVRAACRRVWNKWSSTGHEADAAESWAWDLVAEYAAEDGIELVELDYDAPLELTGEDRA